jgi:hypothetical protein
MLTEMQKHLSLAQWCDRSIQLREAYLPWLRERHPKGSVVMINLLTAEYVVGCVPRLPRPIDPARTLLHSSIPRAVGPRLTTSAKVPGGEGWYPDHRAELPALRHLGRQGPGQPTE